MAEESKIVAGKPAEVAPKRAKAEPSKARASNKGSGEPPVSLIGGRLLIGIGLLFGIVAVAPQGMNAWLDRHLHPSTPKPTVSWAVGKEADVELTLITADAK